MPWDAKAVDRMSEDSEADPLTVARSPTGLRRTRRRDPLSPLRPVGSAAGPLPTLIYYHGGGFVIGNLETHDSTCRRLANKSRCQVMSIDYRLSPEHPFPRRSTTAWRPSGTSATMPASFGADPRASPSAAIPAGGAIAAVVCQCCVTPASKGPPSRC
jgi:acetyl esterase